MYTNNSCGRSPYHSQELHILRKHHSSPFDKPGMKKHNFEDFATDEDKEIVRKAKNGDISDDELFE